MSNMSTLSPPVEAASSARRRELIAADGERVQMRVSFKAKGLGVNIAASILSVNNEVRQHIIRVILLSTLT